MGLRKTYLDFMADWIPVRKGCVVDPACCSRPVRVCDFENCKWTMPDILYATFEGLPAGLSIHNQSYQLTFIPQSAVSIADIFWAQSAGGDMWALGDVDISGTFFNPVAYAVLPPPGPVHCQFLRDEILPGGGVAKHYLAMFVSLGCGPQGVNLKLSCVELVHAGIDPLLNSAFNPLNFDEGFLSLSGILSASHGFDAQGHCLNGLQTPFNDEPLIAPLSPPALVSFTA